MNIPNGTHIKPRFVCIDSETATKQTQVLHIVRLEMKQDRNIYIIYVFHIHDMINTYICKSIV